MYENHYDALTFFNCMLILHIAVIESGTKIVIPPSYVQNIRPIKITDTVNVSQMSLDYAAGNCQHNSRTAERSAFKFPNENAGRGGSEYSADNL